METLAMEFMFRNCRLRMDGKCLFSMLEISSYEFKKFIVSQEKEGEHTTYSFTDGSRCKREYSCWQIL